jgi:histidine kinase
MRSRLGWKLFAAFALVIAMAVASLLLTAEILLPRVFDRHMGAMGTMMAGGMAGIGGTVLDGFRNAFHEAVLVGAAVAIVASAAVSWLLARRTVAPLSSISRVAEQIARGRYSQRVPVPGTGPIEGRDELAQLAVRFNAMAEQLEQIEARRAQLIGTVAHELRTPLAAIKGSLEGLMDGVLAAEPETFHRLAQETDRLQRLVADLQELSRAEAGVIELDRKRQPAHQVLSAAADRLRQQFEDKGVALVVDLPNLPAIDVDADRMIQVLVNLLGNGLQFTDPGGWVRLTAEVKDDYVRATVTDNGVGIPAASLPLVFDRFYRVEAWRSRRPGGSGIGLTIARHLVEAHGGRIWAESEGIGTGSAVHFTLPLSADAEER